MSMTPLKSTTSIIMTMILVFHFSCKMEPPTDLAKTSFIPRPVSVNATQHSFTIDGSTTVFFKTGNSNLEQTADYLASQVQQFTNFLPEVKSTDKMPGKGIYLKTNNLADSLGNEGYKLTIDKKRITIEANDVAGCFYGVQTLLQTLPAPTDSVYTFNIPTGIIVDFPVYGHRGAMLDVSRHFFGVEDVKRFIDFLAMYKMNRLHLHLSDDQGWRIEIKTWPNLTEHGGSTQVGGGEGGYYTQEEYTEIVDYALKKQITVIPEIDMPGHTNAALASYPELNCDGKARELYTGTKVGFSTLCIDKEITYRFVDDVVREISELTPGPYFHIGGDESWVTPLDDYIYFINRVQSIVTNYGKKVIGWDEIANASLADGTVVQYWSDKENTTKGLKQGARVIMSPAKYAYLDMKYDSTTQLGLNWAGYIEVDKAYSWKPDTLVPGLAKKDILGIEAPLWTETVTHIDEIEFMVFPRLPGYAEIGWTPGNMRSWDEYKHRLAEHGKRFEAMDIDYYRSEKVPWK